MWSTGDVVLVCAGDHSCHRWGLSFSGIANRDSWDRACSEQEAETKGRNQIPQTGNILVFLLMCLLQMNKMYQVPYSLFCHSSIGFLSLTLTTGLLLLPNNPRFFLEIGASCLLLLCFVPHSKHQEDVWMTDLSFWLLTSFTWRPIHHLSLFNSQNDSWPFLVLLVLGFHSRLI